VAHLDPNAYYGAGQASLTADELVEWADKQTDSPTYRNVTCSRELPPQSRQYAISLAPALIPSIGPLIDSLIASGVARYGGYKLLERVAIYDSSGSVRTVPGSKEDVFKSKDMSLIDKRRLMRFLMFAAGEFESGLKLAGNEETPFLTYLRERYTLPEKVAEAITYALAFRTSATGKSFSHLYSISR
jgi:Rab proteins geranylgeranyltransferase component A